MPVPSTIADISDNPTVNSPAGTDQIAGTLDDYLRAIQAIVKKQWITGGTLAAGATLAVPASGTFIDVTGAGTIQQISNSFDGRFVILRFANGIVLQHSSALILPGAVNITCTTNDCGVFVQTAAGTWTCAAFSRSMNADMVDGYHAGNASGQVAVANGTVCANLNADLLDGQHGAYYATAAAVATAQSTANGKASKAGDTFTGAIYVSSASEAQVHAAMSGQSTAYLFSGADEWGLYSADGGYLVHYIRASGRTYVRDVDTSLIVQNNSGTYNIHITGNADTVDGWHRDDIRAWGNLTGKPAGADIPFNWAGQAGQPAWVWGGNDGSNAYVWNPANFSVAYAAYAGSADTINGYPAAQLWRTDQEAHSFTRTGYQKLPSGLIMQWGTHSHVGGTGEIVTFPIPFPTACLNITTSNADGLGGNLNIQAYNLTTTNFTAKNNNAGAVKSAWLAIGY